MSQTSPTPESLVRTAQIITLAMAVGVVMFVIVAVAVVGVLNQPPSGNVISLIAALFTFGQLGLAVFVPDLIVNQRAGMQAQLSGELRPYGAFMTRHIIRLALLEGAAFFNIVVTFIEHNWWSLGIAGLLVGWMLTNFPTRDRVERWIAAKGIGTGE